MSETVKKKTKGTKLKLTDYKDQKVLYIMDINRLASTEFVSMEQEQRSYKFPRSVILDDKLFNTSIMYEVFRRMLKVPLNSVDYAFAFDTHPNMLRALEYKYRNGFVLDDNEYFGQLNALRYLLKKSNFTVLEQDGYEAYNLIDKCVKDNYDYYDKIFIFTIDRVLYPLTDNKVHIITNQHKKDDITPYTFESALGVPYNLLQLQQCIVGDERLSTKGVRLIGPKKFTKMLEQDDLLRMIPNSLTTEQMIEQSKYLTKTQKLEALDELHWLVRREGTFCDTRIRKCNTVILNSYLDYFGLKQFIER